MKPPILVAAAVAVAVSLTAVSGCAEAMVDSGFRGRTSMPDLGVSRQPRPPFDATFHMLSSRQKAPSSSEVARELGEAAVPVRRPDRHEEVRFGNGFRYVRVLPAPPDGRPRYDVGTMAGLMSPLLEGDDTCVTISQTTSELISAGWTGPQFPIERHSVHSLPYAEPVMLTRHDSHLRLYLLPSIDGSPNCLGRYALIWNMDLSGLMQLMHPE